MSLSGFGRSVAFSRQCAASSLTKLSGAPKAAPLLSARSLTVAPPVESHPVHDPHVKDVYQPPEFIRKHAHINSTEEYFRKHQKSLVDPDAFWANIANDFQWKKKWDKVVDYDFHKGHIKWFEGAELNITENCLDRHLAAGFGNRPAVTFEAENGDSKVFTFQEVLENVNAMCQVLEANGLKKGDTCSVYLPMIPELLCTVLACARMGVIHSVIFAGFSAEAVAERIFNCKSKVVITADAGFRGGKVIPLKSVVNTAVDIAEKRGVKVGKVLVTHRAGDGAKEGLSGWVPGRDVSLDSALAEAWRHSKGKGQALTFTPAVMGAEDPLFILYTSGSTGTPKGVLHTQAGYMVWAATTFKYIFDIKPTASSAYSSKLPESALMSSKGAFEYKQAHPQAVTPDLHFCTADIGWVTGHSYIAYGPLLNGSHTLLFEGTPTYPGPDRLWDVVEKHRATTLYTAPTAIRSLMVHGTEPVKKHDLSSLRILGSVGEPINPEAWRWYHNAVGRSQLPIVDTWWQTETGGIMITSLPGATHMKPGMATKPFLGVSAKVVRQDGTECEDDESGFLVVDKPWPGMMRTVYGDHARFKQAYFEQMPGVYFTGDGAVRDKDGDIKILGRTDDVINVSGHRLGTAEVEAALALHEDVAEAAVVGFPHQLKGEGIFSFVTLKNGKVFTPQLQKELVATVRRVIGPIANPDVILPAAGLPKTRSGKIMRRILKKVAAGETDTKNMGDTSTLADPAVVAALIQKRAEVLGAPAAAAVPEKK